MTDDDLALASLSRRDLGELVREALLGGHLIDRASMPHIIGAWGRENMRDIAIDEWMGASPIYTRRIQALLGIRGDGVEAIFKAMQFDIGAPPQFMDFRYALTDPYHGEFWLNHCGALMDVEPMGDEFVFTMCHEIEDPTFDATAYATNPRARMRPIHRPPRVPADRHPHCAWTVAIEPTAPALPEPEMTALVATTRAATLALTSVVAPTAPDTGTAAADDEVGFVDYAGPLVADIDFAAFRASTLRALFEEICVQWQLLAISGLLSIDGRYGDTAAADVGLHQFTGVAGVTATRLHAMFGLGATLHDAATLLGLHPALRPRAYVALRTACDDTAATLHVDILDCAALDDPSGLSWLALLVAHDVVAPLEVIVQAVDPHFVVTRVQARAGSVASYEVRRAATPAPVHPDVALARFSTGAEFSFAPTPTRVEIRPRAAAEH